MRSPSVCENCTTCCYMQFDSFDELTCVHRCFLASLHNLTETLTVASFQHVRYLRVSRGRQCLRAEFQQQFSRYSKLTTLQTRPVQTLCHSAIRYSILESYFEYKLYITLSKRLLPYSSFRLSFGRLNTPCPPSAGTLAYTIIALKFALFIIY
jgi:hypothetical protein